jgi:antitoxin HigA-1
MSTWRITMGANHRSDSELPGLEPPHPGEYIRKDLLPAVGMSISQLADHLGVTRATLSALVNGRSDLSLEMAQRLGKAFRNGTRFWMALQMQRDIWFAEKHKKISVRPLKRTPNVA